MRCVFAFEHIVQLREEIWAFRFICGVVSSLCVFLGGCFCSNGVEFASEECWLTLGSLRLVFLGKTICGALGEKGLEFWLGGTAVIVFLSQWCILCMHLVLALFLLKGCFELLRVPLKFANICAWLYMHAHAQYCMWVVCIASMCVRQNFSCAHHMLSCSMTETNTLYLSVMKRLIFTLRSMYMTQMLQIVLLPFIGIAVLIPGVLFRVMVSTSYNCLL